MAGIGSKHLGEIERGTHNPRLATMTKLAFALDLRLSELIALYEERLDDDGA